MPPFDIDMIESEMVVCYYNRGDKLDVDAYYSHLLSKLTIHYVRFLELYNIKSMKELKEIFIDHDDKLSEEGYESNYDAEGYDLNYVETFRD